MLVVKIKEAEWSKDPLDIDEQQAQALRQVGIRLAGKGKFWGDPVLDENDLPHEASVIELKKHRVSGYQIYVRHAIGSIGIDDLTIHVAPKIDEDHFKFILNESESELRNDHQRVVLPEDSSLAQVVARWFIRASEGLLKRGLLKDYRELSDSLSFARGRIRPLQTARHFYSGRTLLDVDFEEFDQDTPLNRLIKAAALSIARRNMFPKEMRTSARRIILLMADVSSLQISDMDACTDRQTKSYELPIDLAKRVLRSQGIFADHGSSRAWAFLFPTPLLVESGVRNILQRELGSKYKVRKHGLRLHNSDHTLNPDLVFQPGDAGSSIFPALITGDVKYKTGELARSDLYQAVTFATHYEASHAIVISFTDQILESPAPIRVGPKTVHIVHWKCGSDVVPETASKNLVAEIRSILDQLSRNSELELLSTPA